MTGERAALPFLRIKEVFVMKKAFALLLMLCMLCSCALAEDLLTDKAVELVQRMDALAGSAEYRACIGVNGGEMGRMVDGFAAGAHDQPRMMVAVDISPFTALIMDQVTLDPIAREELLGKMASAMVMQLVSARGTSTLAAVNSMMTGTIFAMEGEAARGVYLLLYENATPAAVSWTAKSGAVSMTAMFLPDDDLAACSSAQAVNDWFTARDVPVSCMLTE